MKTSVVIGVFLAVLATAWTASAGSLEISSTDPGGKTTTFTKDYPEPTPPGSRTTSRPLTAEERMQQQMDEQSRILYGTTKRMLDNMNLKMNLVVDDFKKDLERNQGQ